jgi:hypothetical protein
MLKPSSVRKCSKCGEPKPLSEFSHNPTVSDGRQSQCKRCKADYMKRFRETHGNARTAILNEARRRKNMEILMAHFEDHPCVDCGETDPVVLDFDHIDGKNYTISKILSYSAQTLMREIQRCEVRCANCHRKKTAKEQQWYSYLGRNHDQDAHDRMDQLGLKYRK